MLKTMPAARIEECIADAARSPLAEAGVRYPQWYLHRWHFLPEGYMSQRGAASYTSIVVRLYNLASEAQLHRRLVAELARRAPGSVLEIGCGPGTLLAAMRRALPQTALTGIDLSPFMLEIAHVSLPADGADLVHGDATQLPWDDASFDAVVSQHVLGHFPRGAAAVAWREAARVLRPGGSLYLLEHAWHRRLPGRLRRVLWERLAGGVILFERFEKAWA